MLYKISKFQLTICGRTEAFCDIFQLRGSVERSLSVSSKDSAYPQLTKPYGWDDMVGSSQADTLSTLYVLITSHS